MPTSKLTLSSEVKYLKGVGPMRAELLAARGIRTVEDLLYYTPFRYEDRTRVTPVRDLVAGQWATVFAEILTCGLMRTRGGKYIYDLAARDASDGTGPTSFAGQGTGGVRRKMIRCKWFNAVYLERNKIFRPGQRVFFYGRVDVDRFGVGNLQIIQPQYEIVQEAATDPESKGESSDSNAAGGVTEASLQVGRVVPIYEAIGVLSTRVLRRLLWTALASVEGQVAECLPESVCRRNKLMPRGEALARTHFPGRDQPLDALARFRTPAQVGLIFEEFFNVGAGLALKRRKMKSVEGIPFRVTPSVRQAIK
ncbi:MAG TPA: hypothetical protein VJV74_01580, partial [Terriglobia bacterium]|nr:hypothetical protein [Terriglobia bacterium]